MVLNNVKVVGSNSPVNIGISNGKIANISSSAVSMGNALQLTFDEALVFPGLINSHDHLDFNLFPQLGDKIYNNYTEWGNYIHTKYTEEIGGILKIPALLRSRWGMYKNLLCGVTTVVNHGEPLAANDDLITIFEGCNCLHSVHFEKNWILKLNKPGKATLPVVIHTGEGDDVLAHQEINQLIRWNLFRKKLIGIHGVAMSEKQAKKFEALVWCPQSNYFLLNKTAEIDLLQKQTSILFGTDSTLTSSWDIWEHLRLARETRKMPDDELYNTINTNAAKTWQLNCGELAMDRDADIVVAKSDPGKDGADAFFALTPADLLLVIHKGHIRLFDETLLNQLLNFDLSDFSKFYINGACKYVQGDLAGLMEKVKEYHPAVDFPIAIENLQVV